MIATITTTYRGPTDSTGSRITAVARLKADGSTVRVTRNWNHLLTTSGNHRTAALAVLDKAGINPDAYVLDGFSHDGVGTWVAATGEGSRLLRLAEDLLVDLRAEYQKGEAEDLREKYLDEVREQVDRADAIVAFIKSNL